MRRTQRVCSILMPVIPQTEERREIMFSREDTPSSLEKLWTLGVSGVPPVFSCLFKL